MYEELTPPEKKARHGFFMRYVYISISFLLSLFFVMTLMIGAIFYHLKHKITGEEKFNEPVDSNDLAYKPRKAYPNSKKMKASKDLRYYALQLDLDLQEYKITTEDGYILTLHRLINPKETEEDRKTRKPILFQHGLLSCSGAYLTPGTNSLAYYFLETGYDVWMGNNRSWFDVVHTTMKGNLMNSEEYWDWDIRELAYYDLPCIIENVLSHKPNHDKLILVGHLQGCTQSFIMLKNNNLKHIHLKIDYFFALAPAIFPGSLFHERAFIKFMHHRGPLGYKIMYGCCSFLRNLSQARQLLSSTRLFGFLSYIMFKYLFGWNAKKWGKDKKIWHFNFVFNVSYVSAKLMSWWLSEWVEEGFSNQLLTEEAYKSGANYIIDGEHKAEIATKDDSKTYFPFSQSWFEDKETTVPMLIFTCDLDFLVDGKRLITHMTHFEKSYQVGVNLDFVALDDYSHVDVVWAEDLIGRIGYVITNKLTSLDESIDQEKNIT